MAGAGIRITLTALALALAAPAVASAELRWKPCRGGASAAVCARLTVPLDRSGALPGTVPLRIGRFPGSGDAKPTLMYLSGGPGSGGLEEMASVVDYVPALRESYRVVGFDQRGT